MVINPTLMKKDQWYYLAPKWYHRFRGGTFVLITVTSPYPQFVKEALQFAEERRTKRLADWKIERIGNERYEAGEAIFIRLKDKADMLQFKLTYCEIA